MLKLNSALHNTGRKLLANYKNKDSKSDGVGTMSLLPKEHIPCLQHARVGLELASFCTPTDKIKEKHIVYFQVSDLFDL